MSGPPKLARTIKFRNVPIAAVNSTVRIRRWLCAWQTEHPGVAASPIIIWVSTGYGP